MEKKASIFPLGENLTAIEKLSLLFKAPKEKAVIPDMFAFIGVESNSIVNLPVWFGKGKFCQIVVLTLQGGGAALSVGGVVVLSLVGKAGLFDACFVNIATKEIATINNRIRIRTKIKIRLFFTGFFMVNKRGGGVNKFYVE